jgi:hypothetical protein
MLDGATDRDSRLPAQPRDPTARERYLIPVWAEIPRLLGAIDRNPFRPTYGCLDREYWHYRTSSFPSEMFQEGVLPLALVYAQDLPGNRWRGNPRVRELALAAIRFAARSSHRDGSCDDYYPFERALGAAVFSLQAAARAYRLLKADDAELAAWLRRRADWLAANEESGKLANHHALAALGLLRVAEITGDHRFREAADARLRVVLDWQSSEGWFEEYGGADPGYQTVTIDCLAQYRQLTNDTRLDEPLARALGFARWFLHPDGSYAGEYGSRGTYHFYPHGMELWAGANADAADLADGFLQSLAAATQAHFSDDRMYVHRLANLIDAYRDWSPVRPRSDLEPSPNRSVFFPRAQILVRRAEDSHTVVSAARGGVFKHVAPQRPPITDAGLILETTDRRVAASQWHGLDRHVEVGELSASFSSPALVISGRLQWCRFETATPLKQAVFHVGMWLVGRRCRTLVRRLLQRRLITGRRDCPIRLTRRFDFPIPDIAGVRGNSPGASPPKVSTSLRVTDAIELLSPQIRVKRMAFGSDHEVAYVAASGAYQEAVLQPWTELDAYVEELNLQRRVVIVRELASIL